MSQHQPVWKGHEPFYLNATPSPRTAKSPDDQLVFIGLDDRGVELEVIAVQMPEYLLILPLMPYQYRSIR